MDDRKLESLLRMALEAEDIERSAAPQLRVVGARTRRRNWLLPVATAMAAAAAALAIVTLILPSLSPAPNGVPIASSQPSTHRAVPEMSGSFDTPLNPAETVDAEEASVVLAFFQGIDGRCTCLHIQDEEWDRDKLANKDRADLLNVAYRSSCGAPSPALLVVAIAGKRDMLPRTPEAAEALASQLAAHTGAAKADLVNRAYQALPGLPAGSMVVAETVGHRSAIMDFAKIQTR